MGPWNFAEFGRILKDLEMMVCGLKGNGLIIERAILIRLSGSSI